MHWVSKGAESLQDKPGQLCSGLKLIERRYHRAQYREIYILVSILQFNSYINPEFLSLILLLSSIKENQSRLPQPACWSVALL